MKRAIERYVVYPLASLLATEQVSLGDVISIDWDGGENGLTFLKEAEGALVPDGRRRHARDDDRSSRSDLRRPGDFLSGGNHAAAKMTTEAKPSSAQAHRSLPAEKAKNEKR